MVVATLQLTLAIEAANSLKAKRKVVKSLIERARHRFHCAIAEVDAHDLHNRAVLGIAVVSNDTAFANASLDKIRDFIEADGVGRADIIDVHLEILHV